jgi:hypothetical protein
VGQVSLGACPHLSRGGPVARVRLHRGFSTLDDVEGIVSHTIRFADKNVRATLFVFVTLVIANDSVLSYHSRDVEVS